MLVEAMNGLEIGSLAEIDDILRRLWDEGHDPLRIMAGGTAIRHLLHLAQGMGSLIQVPGECLPRSNRRFVAITGYVHPATGATVPVGHFPPPRAFREGFPDRDMVAMNRMPIEWRKREEWIEFYAEGPG